jgi:hypothetical protein
LLPVLKSLIVLFIRFILKREGEERNEKSDDTLGAVSAFEFLCQQRIGFGKPACQSEEAE